MDGDLTGVGRPPEHIVAYLEGLVGDLDAFASRLAAASPASTSGFESAGNMPTGLLAQHARLRADGTVGLAKARQGAALSSKQQCGLEALVALEARPAMLIRDGEFEAPPADWSVLETHRAAIKAVLPRVGRVEVSGHPELDWIGTGFLAGPDVVMTNAHVAAEFGSDSAGPWSFKLGMTSRLDFLREAGSKEASELAILEILAVHDDHDLALLRVESPRASSALAAGPLSVSSAPPSLAGRRLYVVGYPSPDSQRNVPAEMLRIFSDVYDVKRLQPGQALSFSPGDYALRHDCSTLGGNSGSPVIDLETHQVLGLHFAGKYLEANYAVPLWTLADDPKLRAAGVNFV